jgi:hypothetical protein
METAMLRGLGSGLGSKHPKCVPLGPRVTRPAGLARGRLLLPLRQAPGVEPAGPCWNQGQGSGHPRRESQLDSHPRQDSSQAQA